MMATTTPLAEITQEAIRVLFREIGVANTVRFLNQYTSGYGNYTEEREQLFGHLPMDEIVARIKEDRERTSPQSPVWRHAISI
jgi:hypothetical protein